MLFGNNRSSEELHERELAPIVMREIMSQPRSLRVTPSSATDPRQLAADLRSRINPVYASMAGTESYERRACADAIESLLAQLNEQAARVKWMADRISYVEHSAADGTPCVKIKVGGYWPQGEHEEDNADPDMIGLKLIEYVDAQIKGAK